MHNLLFAVPEKQVPHAYSRKMSSFQVSISWIYINVTNKWVQKGKKHRTFKLSVWARGWEWNSSWNGREGSGGGNFNLFCTVTYLSNLATVNKIKKVMQTPWISCVENVDTVWFFFTIVSINHPRPPIDCKI